MMKFIASDVEEAKAKARRAFGEKLVVIGVRELPGGEVELSASDQPETIAPSDTPTGQFGRDARDIVANEKSPARRGNGLEQPLERKFAEDNLAQLSDRLSGHGGLGTNGSADHISGDSLAAALSAHGIGAKLIEAVCQGASKARIDDDLFRLETGLDDAFSFAPTDIGANTPIMLVGPTGAGKTSCAAKLAARAMTHRGAAFMMTADTGRAGAIDQIRTYGEILGADYHIVETPHEATAAISNNGKNCPVIFDTPGISPFEPGDIAALRNFQEALHAEPILVLPASGDREEYADWADAFAEFGARRIILTKFDATRRVGPGLDAAYGAGLTLAHLSETPFISEGLLDASPQFLARRLVSGGVGRVAG